jgi:hypothetical protein
LLSLARSDHLGKITACDPCRVRNANLVVARSERIAKRGLCFGFQLRRPNNRQLQH